MLPLPQNELEKKMVGIRSKLKKRLKLKILERRIWFEYMNMVVYEIFNRERK